MFYTVLYTYRPCFLRKRNLQNAMEGKKLSNLNLRLPAEMLEALNQEAAENGTGVLSDYVRQILGRRNLTGNAPPETQELQKQIEQLTARLNKANRDLQYWGAKPV